MAKGQCREQIHQQGLVLRCDRDAGHEKSKEPSEAIHDASGVTWYSGDEAVEISEAEE